FDHAQYPGVDLSLGSRAGDDRAARRDRRDLRRPAAAAANAGCDGRRTVCRAGTDDPRPLLCARHAGSLMPAHALNLRSVELFERPVALRLPFSFGAATVTQCPQAFVRLEADVGGHRVVGATAELMIPKWFDKSPALSHAQNFET